MVKRVGRKIIHPPSLWRQYDNDDNVRDVGCHIRSTAERLVEEEGHDVNCGTTVCHQHPFLYSPLSFAAKLGQIPTPQREAYFSILCCNEKCAESLNKVSEPINRPLNFGPMTQQSNMITPSARTRTSNPFNYHLPNKHGGCHRLIGCLLDKILWHSISVKLLTKQQQGSVTS